MLKRTIFAILVATSLAFTQEANTRYGGRIAFNSSSANGTDFGSGFEIGGVVSIPISGSITFNPGLNFIYRASIINENNDDIYINDVTEFALSIPCLFQGMPFGGPVFYINGGIQIDFPFNSTIDFDYNGYNMERRITLENYLIRGQGRSFIDVGAVLGIGWFVGKHLAVDWKLMVIGLTHLLEEDEDAQVKFNEYRLLQAALGLVYLF